MCLGIPARITEIDGDFAIVDIDGAFLRIGLQLIEDPQVDDYVIVHTGYALEKIDKIEAVETIENIRKLQNPENNL